MSELVKICQKKELPKPGQAKEFSAGRRALCVANVDGVVRALDNECPHHGGPLSEGMIEDGKVICPWHAWAFDVVTGLSEDGDEHVGVYPVVEQGDDVFVEV